MPPVTAMEANDPARIVGHSDGIERGYAHGWAWYPNRPGESVVIQIWADGALISESAACQFRPDLKTAGIGFGRHAFAIPFDMPPDAPASIAIVIRAKDGPVLQGGEFTLHTTAESRAADAYRRSTAYLEAAFGPLCTTAPAPRVLPAPASPTPINFILYSATADSPALSKALGQPEYSYFFVLRAFREVLRRLGTVHLVRDPAAEVDAIADACAARGEACLFLSFAPPNHAATGLRCPAIPVVAWEYNTIPNEAWEGDARNDWRFVLRQTGRAITLSHFAAHAFRAVMGRDFPVAAIPSPIWDRMTAARALAGPRPAPARLSLQGFAYDTRVVKLTLEMDLPAMPVLPARAPVPAITAMWRWREAEVTGAARDRFLAARRQAELDIVAARMQAEAAAEAAAQAGAARADEAARLAAAAEAAAALARHQEALRLELARLDAERLARESIISLRPTNWRGRIAVTLKLLLTFYRQVLRDLMPRPLRWALSRAGRLALRLVRGGRVPEVILAAPAAIEAATPPATVAPAAAVAPPPEPPAPAPVPSAPHLSRLLPPGAEPPADIVPFPVVVLAETGLPPPAIIGGATSGVEVVLDGVVFTAVLAPKDGRKNWQDLLTAFCTELRDRDDATLVLKMVGADPAFWWYEFHDLAKRLPAFTCRVLVLHGFLDDANYNALIAATHFVANASLAEGQCLPLAEFMSAGRPAIAPRHTAMLDYINADNALIVASQPEPCGWPADPRNLMTTTRHRIEWPSLRQAFAGAYQIAKHDPARYAAMAQASQAAMRDYCGDAVVADHLTTWLGLPAENTRSQGWHVTAAPQAETLLEGLV